MFHRHSKGLRKSHSTIFIIHRLTAGVDNTLQKEISFLQLIEEERISLREFEGTEVMLGDRFGTHHIQTCEKPATAGRFLIGDTFGRHFDGENVCPSLSGYPD